MAWRLRSCSAFAVACSMIAWLGVEAQEDRAPYRSSLRQMPSVSGFQPRDSFVMLGGGSRTCLGDAAGSASVRFFNTLQATTLFKCKALCVSLAGCQGIDYGPNGCQVWLLPAVISSTFQKDGHQCFQYLPFVPIDGGSNRSCRGGNATDISSSYFKFLAPDAAPTLASCKAGCASLPGCKGLQFSSYGCNLWTRPFGIQATSSESDSTCLRYEPFVAADGGQDRSCRGSTVSDDSPDYYQQYLSVTTYDACRAMCVGTPGCRGLEYNAQFQPPTCKVWTRAAGIGTTAPVPGSFCLRYGTVLPGSLETGARRGQIHLRSDPTKCLEIHGNAIRLSSCLSAAEPSQEFLIPGNGSCITSASSPLGWISVQNPAGRALQVGPCTHNQFLLPDSGTGQIRWGLSFEKCVAVQPGGAVQLQDCSGAVPSDVEFILPHGTTANLQSTLFVTHYLPWFLGSNVDAACANNTACTYKNDHWCSASYGNSYYASALGAYDIMQAGTVEQQLELMVSAGIDGLWIDYQTSAWDSAIDLVIAAARAKGLSFAIVVDTALRSDLMTQTATKLAQWTQEPHYFRHQGFPIVPVFNHASTVFMALSFSAVYLSRFELPSVSWAVDQFTWVSPVFDWGSYYLANHNAFATGSAFRGYVDCYQARSLAQPYTGMLTSTLQSAVDYMPKFVQLTTWNDYTEGTMIEPSWLRQDNQCVSVCRKPCSTTASCFTFGTFLDCTKPQGGPTEKPFPACNITGNVSSRDDLDTVQTFTGLVRSTSSKMPADFVLRVSSYPYSLVNLPLSSNDFLSMPRASTKGASSKSSLAALACTLSFLFLI